VQSADRALAILAAFSPARPELGVSELAAELGMHKSTASRLLAVLQARGLVRRAGDRFSPGPELARLGALAVRSLSLAEVARAPLDRLASLTGETVNLAVRQGDQALNVSQVQTAHVVGVTDWTGQAAALHATANGKALLAFGDSPLPTELPRLTPATITAVDALAAELDRIRGRGYATAVEELELGLHAVAAPVFDSSGACVAAVSASGPSYRLTTQRLAPVGEACVAAADEISECLGHRRAA
jgi:IclR family transcriptional regulator, acetate operon repressor